MIEKINLNHILFLDIETVPEVQNFNNLDDEMKYLFEHKTPAQKRLTMEELIAHRLSLLRLKQNFQSQY